MTDLRFCPGCAKHQVKTVLLPDFNHHAICFRCEFQMPLSLEEEAEMVWQDKAAPFLGDAPRTLYQVVLPDQSVVQRATPHPLIQAEFKRFSDGFHVVQWYKEGDEIPTDAALLRVQKIKVVERWDPEYYLD